MGSVPAEPLEGRLRRAALDGFVGRERERSQLIGLLGQGVRPAVMFVHGSGGIGKTALVAAVIPAASDRMLWLDGRDLEPTPTGVLAALADQLGLRLPVALEQLGPAIAATGAGVLVIDSFERLNITDGWLRNELVSVLPANMTVVLVGRRGPNSAWRSSPGWRNLIAELEVDAMANDDIARLAAGHALTPAIAAKVVRFARGHPLAAELAADAFARRPDLELGDGPPAEVIEELFDVLLDDLQPADRRMLESVAVLRRVTRPLLRAVLDEDQQLDDAWRTLRGLPVVRATPAGLELAAVAQEVLSSGLEARDPDRVRKLRRQAATTVLAETGGTVTWAATADLMYLVQNPVIRNSYLPPGGLQHPVERAGPDDLPAIMSIVERFDGPAGTAVARLWWRHHRGSFVVARGPDGSVVAFGVAAELADIHPAVLADDPVTGAIAADVRRRPPDGRVLVSRRSLGARFGEQNSPELATIIIDLKRYYFELRPDLTRVYAALGDWAGGAALVRMMGFRRVGEPVRIGAGEVQPIALDFGPGSVDGWIARHILAEVRGDVIELPPAPGQPPEPRTPAPPLATLSAREREVLVALADGLTNQQLADRLFISERTANRHLSNIFTKLGVRNRTAAARMAIQAGLVG